MVCFTKFAVKVLPRDAVPNITGVCQIFQKNMYRRTLCSKRVVKDPFNFVKKKKDFFKNHRLLYKVRN